MAGLCLSHAAQRTCLGAYSQQHEQEHSGCQWHSLVARHGEFTVGWIPGNRARDGRWWSWAGAMGLYGVGEHSRCRVIVRLCPSLTGKGLGTRVTR